MKRSNAEKSTSREDDGIERFVELNDDAGFGSRQSPSSFVCPKNPVNFNVNNVRVVKLLGGGLHNCSIVRGMVLKTDAVGSIKQVKNAKVDVVCGRIRVVYFRFKHLDDGIYEAVKISG